MSVKTDCMFHRYEKEENYTLNMCSRHTDKLYGVTSEDCDNCEDYCSCSTNPEEMAFTCVSLPKEHGRIIDADEFLCTLLTKAMNSDEDKAEIQDSIKFIKHCLDTFATTLVEPAEDNPYDISKYSI